LSVAEMCRHSFDLLEVAEAIEAAVEKTLDDGFRTGDINQEGMKLLGTKEMTQAICERIKA